MEDKQQVEREVQTTDQQVGDTAVRREVVSERTSAPTTVVLQRTVWYIVGVIVVVLAIRFVLLLLGANEGNGFVDFIYGFSGVFAAPFYGIFSYQPSYGQSTFETSTLVAIAIYALVGWGIAKLTTLGSNRTV